LVDVIQERPIDTIEKKSRAGQVELLWITLLLLGVVLLAVWLPRGLALDRFATPDEAAWVGRSASFYHALLHRDFAGTFQHSHPGVTATWAGAVAFRLHYPGLASQVEARTLKNWERVEPLLRERGYRPVEILATARAFMVLGTTAALGIAWLYALRLLGLWPALAGLLLLAFDPLHVGLTRLLHLDGLASSLMLASCLAFLAFVHRGRRWIDLVLAAGLAGLAWLTKVPALYLIPFFGLVMVIEMLRGWREAGRLRSAGFVRAAWPLLAWAGMSAVVFVLFWPAMWVDPLGTLEQVFSRSLSYAEEGHSSVIFFNGQVFAGDPGWSFYPVNYLWRATPPVLFGLVLAGIALLRGRLPSHRPETGRIIVLLALYAVLFGVGMSLGAKKFDRYLVPSFPALDMVAGFGWAALLGWLWGAAPRLPVRLAGAAAVGLAIVWQLLLALQTAPYYLSYYNPLLGGSERAPQVMMIGWGEGLDQAARYLNALPVASGLRVMSHYPEGSFSYFFDGETLHLPERWEGPAGEQVQGADYLVLYIHQWQRQRPDPAMLEYFAAQTPEFVVHINGLDYARVYNLEDLLP
jgi:hypothetical protein